MRALLVVVPFAVAVAAAACGEVLAASPAEPAPSVDASTDAPGPSSDGASGDADDANASDAATADVDAATSTDLCGDGGSCRIVFVTSAVYDGNLGGIAGGDQKCAALAAVGTPALANRKFIAYLSNGGGTPMSAALRITPGGPYRRTDGTLVALNQEELRNGPLQAAIDRDELGIPRSDVAVWTGTIPGGNPEGTDCLAWASAASSENGMSGLVAGISNGNWTSEGEEACNLLHRLYCVEN